MKSGRVVEVPLVGVPLAASRYLGDSDANPPRACDLYISHLVSASSSRRLPLTGAAARRRLMACGLPAHKRDLVVCVLPGSSCCYLILGSAQRVNVFMYTCHVHMYI